MRPIAGQRVKPWDAWSVAAQGQVTLAALWRHQRRNKSRNEDGSGWIAATRRSMTVRMTGANGVDGAGNTYDTEEWPQLAAG